MSDDIKIKRLPLVGPRDLTEEEWLASFLAGEWTPMPVRYMTRDELEKEFPQHKEPA